MWSLGVSSLAALYQIPELTTALLESKTNSVVQNQIPLQDLPDYLTLAHKKHCTLEPLLTVMVDKTLKVIPDLVSKQEKSSTTALRLIKWLLILRYYI